MPFARLWDGGKVLKGGKFGIYKDGLCSILNRDGGKQERVEYCLAVDIVALNTVR